MNRPLSAGAILTILAVLLAGCHEARIAEPGPADEEPLPPLGLGLDLPASLPPPGPFRENGEHLAELEEFLLRNHDEMFAHCETESTDAKVKSALDLEWHYRAMEEFILACTLEEARILARAAMRENNESSVREDLRQQALAAIEAVRENLSAHEGPGNAVEAQLWYALARYHFRNAWTIERGAELRWQPYADGTSRTELQLVTAFISFLSPILYSQTYLNVLESYPWTRPACQPPDVEELLARAHDSLEAAQQKAARYGHDEVNPETSTKYEVAYTNNHYTGLMARWAPRLEYMAENGWWSSLLVVEAAINSYVSYWDAFEAPAWPTVEEAQFLLAQKRNESRTIWTEAMLNRFDVYFGAEGYGEYHRWGTDIENGAPFFLSRLEMPWPFEDLECPDHNLH